MGPGLRAERRGNVVSVSSMVVLAAALAVFRLGDESLWIDEAISVFVAWRDWPDLWTHVVHQEPNLGLYYLLLHAWIRLGDGEAAARALSAVAHVATVPVLFFLARRLFDRRVAVIASTLFAINAFAVAYAQEARPYAVAVLLATLCSLLFVRAVHEPSARRWALYVLSAVLAVYAHLFAAFVLAGHAASLFILNRPDRQVRNASMAYSVVAILSAPLLWAVARSGTERISWIDPPTIRDVFAVFTGLAGNGGPLLLLAYSGVCFLALIPAARAWRETGTSTRTWRYAFLLAWLFVPVLLTLAVSAFKPVLIPRYLIVSLPALMLIAGVGLAGLKGRWALALLAVLAVFALRALGILYGTDQKEQWRAATAMVLTASRDGDRIVLHTPSVAMPFAYYVLGTPGGADRAPQAVSPPVAWDESLTSVAPKEPLRNLLGLEERPPRVWLVLSHEDTNAETRRVARSILDTLSALYTRVGEARFIGIRVMLFDSAP